MPWATFLAILLGAVLLIFGIIWVLSQKTIATNPTKLLRSD